jgi:hypothetical protein
LPPPQIGPSIHFYVVTVAIAIAIDTIRCSGYCVFPREVSSCVMKLRGDVGARALLS